MEKLPSFVATLTGPGPRELDNAKARHHCASIGEELYPLSDASGPIRSELKHQLDYLIFTGSLRFDDKLWSSDSSSTDCWAYSHRHNETVQVPCGSKFPAICTSRLPPTTDRNSAVQASSKIKVTADHYTFSGYRDARSFRFLGIPFADPPLESLRFSPPRAYSGPPNIDATKLGNSCIQSNFSTQMNSSMSEDCLYLKIYTPVLPAQLSKNSTSRPVAVYFHGGAFKEGTASTINHDGGNFASRNDVVFVTVNYRVGALGFLATGNLTTGSYGIRDQILALQWANKYIEKFGGDPDQVTIFGQSAGGQSVIALLSSTAAQGLFSGAIIQSAPVDLPWFSRGVYSELIVPEVAKAVGCNQTAPEDALISCLRSVPARQFLDNSTAFQSALQTMTIRIGSKFLKASTLLASIEPLMPMVDDMGTGVINDQFHTLLATDSLPNRVPTMFTTVSNEACYYVGKLISPIGTNQSTLDAVYKLAFPPDLAKAIVTSAAFGLNATDPDGARNALASTLTHSEWKCPQAHLLSQSNNHSFPSLYEVEITNGHISSPTEHPEICSPNPIYNASCHASDVLPFREH